MIKRCGYILTLDPESDRAIFSKNILEKIGFNVILVKAILHTDQVLSNKISMQYIYNLIINSKDNYSYVFEDDINLLEVITLDEIVEYEKYSEMFFYLGICEYGNIGNNTGIKIRNHSVYNKSGFCRGLHAIGLSKKGAEELLKFSHQSKERYMDVILEHFSLLYPANVCRYDLESYIRGHKGILFQDRKMFPSIITNYKIEKKI
jgi:hypothetical protein